MAYRLEVWLQGERLTARDTDIEDPIVALSGARDDCTRIITALNAGGMYKIKEDMLERRIIRTEYQLSLFAGDSK